MKKMHNVNGTTKKQQIQTQNECSNQKCQKCKIGRNDRRKGKEKKAGGSLVGMHAGKGRKERQAGRTHGRQAGTCPAHAYNGIQGIIFPRACSCPVCPCPGVVKVVAAAHLPAKSVRREMQKVERRGM